MEIGQPFKPDQKEEKVMNEEVNKQPSKALIPAGYICGGLSLLFFPLALGVAGTVIGVINLVNGRTGHGIVQITISITCAILGVAIALSM